MRVKKVVFTVIRTLLNFPQASLHCLILTLNTNQSQTSYEKVGESKTCDSTGASDYQNQGQERALTIQQVSKVTCHL